MAATALLVGRKVDNLQLANLLALHALQQGHGVGVDGNLVNVQSALLGHIVVTALALLLLQAERDTADGSALDAAHQAGSVAGNLVAQTLGRDLSKVVEDALVGLEVQGELGVVLFDENAGSALDGLGTDAALHERVLVWLFTEAISVVK